MVATTTPFNASELSALPVNSFLGKLRVLPSYEVSNIWFVSFSFVFFFFYQFFFQIIIIIIISLFFLFLTRFSFIRRLQYLCTILIWVDGLRWGTCCRRSIQQHPATQRSSLICSLCRRSVIHQFAMLSTSFFLLRTTHLRIFTVKVFFLLFPTHRTKWGGWGGAVLFV